MGHLAGGRYELERLKRNRASDEGGRIRPGRGWHGRTKAWGSSDYPALNARFRLCAAGRTVGGPDYGFSVLRGAVLRSGHAPPPVETAG